MNVKDYLEKEYSLSELFTIDDWFNGNKDYQDWCYNEFSKIIKNASFSYLVTEELRLTIKTLIIEQLKGALCSIHISADIL